MHPPKCRSPKPTNNVMDNKPAHRSVRDQGCNSIQKEINNDSNSKW